jgi:hypothetical protein
MQDNANRPKMYEKKKLIYNIIIIFIYNGYDMY